MAAALISRTCFVLLAFAVSAVAQIPGAEWERWPDPAAAGWSASKLKVAREYAAALDTEAVVIVHGGRVVDEWGPVDRKFNIHSVRKSFLSALYGIQVQNGCIRREETLGELGIDDNPPQLTEVEKQATVADLLKARSGVYHPALYETASMKAARPKRHSHRPGEFWYYNNWDFNALGTIYEQKTGRGIYADFLEHIARPVGMQDFRVEDGVYVTGADSIHRAYPFRMTARDMARFGLLYLRLGRWGDRQVIPESWVRESTRQHSKSASSGGYGYLWWTAREGRHFPGVTLPDGSYSARGAGGHYIVVLPALDLVVVHRVNTDKNGRRVDSAAFGQLLKRILEAHPAAPGHASATELLDGHAESLMRLHGVPGLAVAGIENRRISWERYYGLRSSSKH